MTEQSASVRHALEVAVHESIASGAVVEAPGISLQDLAILRRLGLQVWDPRTGMAGGQIEGRFWLVRLARVR